MTKYILIFLPDFPTEGAPRTTILDSQVWLFFLLVGADKDVGDVEPQDVPPLFGDIEPDKLM